MGLEIEGLDVSSGDRQILFELDLSVESGDFFSVLGSEGCGKSTLLRAIAGLAAPDAGSMSLDGEPLDGLPPHLRGVSLVFEDLRLFPGMSVLENVAFPLKMAGVGKRERLAAAKKELSLLGMGAIADLRPDRLSEMQRECAAIAQALVQKPRLLLLDEPFSRLGGQQRTDMRKLLRETHGRLGMTVIQATSDQDDALMLSSRVAFMLEGEIMQCDTPQQVYHYPATLDIAKYFCSGNMLPGNVREGRFESGTILLTAPGLPDGPCMAVIRPGIISVALGPGEFAVAHVEYLGDFQRLYVTRADCALNFVTDMSGAYRPGDMIDLRIHDGKALFYR
jgi:putative spermidine/putrescine transport system ATP-binding protein